MNRLTLQERDLGVLRLLAEHGFATGKAIAERFWANESHYLHYRRLRRLEHSGYIKPLVGDRGARLGYCLTATGAQRLVRQSGDVELHAAGREVYKTTYDHDRLLLKLRGIFERSPAVSNYKTELMLKRSIAKENGKRPLGRDRWKVPDALFQLAVGERRLSIALELEIARKSFLRYDVMLRHLATSPDIDSTFIVFSDRKLSREMQARLHLLKAKDPHVIGCPKYHGFYFSALDDLLKLGLDAPLEGEGKTFTMRSLEVVG